jgi:vacuolar-type H+-ATPase subunit B/Vma2
MTQAETKKLQEVSERAIRMEEKQVSMSEDIQEIKELLKAQDQKFAKFVDASERKFITRLEATAISVFVGFLVSMVVLFINIKEKL